MARQTKEASNRQTKELRTVLKNIVFQELQNLPKNLDKLDAKERLEILTKILPFILPKVESVSHSQGEPFNWDIE